MQFTPPDSLHPVEDVTPDIFHAATLAQRDDLRVMSRRCDFLIATGCVLALLCGCLGLLVWLAHHSVRVVPYVIEVAETGQVRSVGMLPQTWEGSAPAMLERVLRVWLYEMRRVGIDPVMLQEQFKDADLFMTAQAITAAYPHRKERVDLYDKGKTTKIEIRSLLPITPDFHTVEMEWDEQTFTRQGMLEKTEPWKAIISLVVMTRATIDPTKVSDMRNPLGIFIRDFAMQIVSGKVTP